MAPALSSILETLWRPCLRAPLFFPFLGFRGSGYPGLIGSAGALENKPHQRNLPGLSISEVAETRPESVVDTEVARIVALGEIKAMKCFLIFDTRNLLVPHFPPPL